MGQFAYITDNTYKVGQILRMEHLILKVLSFDMAVPTAHLFVNKFARINKASEEALHLALVGVLYCTVLYTVLLGLKKL